MSSAERIALFDADGRAVGADKRANAYARGERVGLVFVWAIWTDAAGVGHMLLQTRGRAGDPYLGSLDAAAGGHIGEGEHPDQAAAREFSEEVGIPLESDELVYLGHCALEDTRAGTPRRAMQFFYACTRPINLSEAVFSEEVSAFVQVTLDDFTALADGTAAEIAGTVRRATAADHTEPVAVASTAFAAYSPPIMDAIRRSARALRHLLDHGVADHSIWQR